MREKKNHLYVDSEERTFITAYLPAICFSCCNMSKAHHYEAAYSY